MKFDYNKLVQKVDTYLRRKRADSRLWAVLLPESLFRPDLWLWERRSVARGAAWGTSWALAPVPMQTIFAVLCSMRTQGNIPMAVLSCFISFPGYQLIAWPLQWYAGSLLLGWMGLSSGVDMELMRSCSATVLSEGWGAAFQLLSQVSLPLLCLELLAGCALTCALIAALAYALVNLLWRKS